MFKNIGLWKRVEWYWNERLKKPLTHIKNNLINYDNNMVLSIDSLIDRNNIIIGLNNNTLRKIYVKLYGCGKMYMDNI